MERQTLDARRLGFKFGQHAAFVVVVLVGTM